jgi:hypothetical protein
MAPHLTDSHTGMASLHLRNKIVKGVLWSTLKIPKMFFTPHNRQCTSAGQPRKQRAKMVSKATVVSKTIVAKV